MARISASEIAVDSLTTAIRIILLVPPALGCWRQAYCYAHSKPNREAKCVVHPNAAISRGHFGAPQNPKDLRPSGGSARQRGRRIKFRKWLRDWLSPVRRGQ